MRLLPIALGLVLVHSASAEEKPLIVCAEPAGMPRTGRTSDGKPQGLDLALAEHLARSLARKLEVHWCASPSCSRKCLREKRCDIILGHPHDADAAKDIAWTVPYVGCQFGLVIAGDAKGITNLSDLHAKRIGIVTGTVGLSESEYKVVHFKTREELLSQFRAARLDAAFLDADFASWHLHQNPKLDLVLVKDFVPAQRWNMALAVRAKDAGLVVDLNKALGDLTESGQIRKIYGDLGVVHRDPFTSEVRRAAAIDTWKRIQERGTLTVSLDPANLPYSSAKDERPGFDVELAHALAKELGVKLHIDWLDVYRTTAIGKLFERKSDLALGTPIDDNAVEDDDDLGGKLLFSKPYYGTGYLLVKRKSAVPVKSLAELKGLKSRQLGTEAGSIADYRLRQRGFLRSLYRNQVAVLKALHDGSIDYAYLWANVGYTLHASPDFAVELVEGYAPEDRWNIAIAMNPGDVDLKRRVDAALDKLMKDGSVARSLAKHKMPYFAPFAEEKKEAKTDAQAAQPGVIRHPKVERLEPQLQFVKTSKNPYDGLERIRSAGTLVVGLDHNSLPFSTAHPKPAGLDHDIAALLARKLGVSLRIYWGYSQHDSYASRLATKKFCDVMLNVTPDARFGSRVLYSKPYYLATYRLVTKESISLKLESLGKEPLAVEQGVAVRGLPEQATLRLYPSLDAILDAVARDEVKAGYVISTRSQWLAERTWPGKLKFEEGAPADRLPICAVVRKTDADLRDAIDRAFAELAQSGELAQVFARWHVPYVAEK